VLAEASTASPSKAVGLLGRHWCLPGLAEWISRRKLPNAKKPFIPCDGRSSSRGNVMSAAMASFASRNESWTSLVRVCQDTAS
jgi:hypothetical protein